MPTQLIDYPADRLIREIYGGVVDVNNLPPDLYFQISNKLKQSLYEGFGGNLKDFDPYSPDGKLLVELRENIYMFSGAKTYQQVRIMSDMLATMPKYSEFKAKAGQVFNQFNETWLQTEYDTAIGMAQSARKWSDIEQEKHIFNMLEYDAVLDANTSDICRPLDGITLPVDDPFWNIHAPLNHFNCRCMLRKVSKYDDKKQTSEATVKKAEKDMEKIQPMFKMNPGKDKIIFSDKHPYFDVAPKDKALAKKNFNLPIPKKD